MTSGSDHSMLKNYERLLIQMTNWGTGAYIGHNRAISPNIALNGRDTYVQRCMQFKNVVPVCLSLALNHLYYKL